MELNQGVFEISANYITLDFLKYWGMAGAICTGCLNKKGCRPYLRNDSLQRAKEKKLLWKLIQFFTEFENYSVILIEFVSYLLCKVRNKN